MVENQTWNEYIPQPIRNDGAGWWDVGPRDVMRDRENPDMLVPPATDAGTLPNLKFSFSDTYMQLNHGGWSREVTVRQLPIATTLAGVNMALAPGGVRELHWHQQAEWAIVLAGRARITAVDQNGRNFIADVGVGDLWYFPPGIPHSIQGLEEGCEFLLVFDDGTFSDLNTLSISDWFAHTRKGCAVGEFWCACRCFCAYPETAAIHFSSNRSRSTRKPTGRRPVRYGTPNLYTSTARTRADCNSGRDGVYRRFYQLSDFDKNCRIAAGN